MVTDYGTESNSNVVHPISLEAATSILSFQLFCYAKLSPIQLIRHWFCYQSQSVQNIKRFQYIHKLLPKKLLSIIEDEYTVLLVN